MRLFCISGLALISYKVVRILVARVLSLSATFFQSQIISLPIKSEHPLQFSLLIKRYIIQSPIFSLQTEIPIRIGSIIFYFLPMKVSSNSNSVFIFSIVSSWLAMISKTELNSPEQMTAMISRADFFCQLSTYFCILLLLLFSYLIPLTETKLIEKIYFLLILLDSCPFSRHEKTLRLKLNLTYWHLKLQIESSLRPTTSRISSSDFWEASKLSL